VGFPRTSPAPGSTCRGVRVVHASGKPPRSWAELDACVSGAGPQALTPPRWVVANQPARVEGNITHGRRVLDHNAIEIELPARATNSSTRAGIAGKTSASGGGYLGRHVSQDRTHWFCRARRQLLTCPFRRPRASATRATSPLFFGHYWWTGNSGTSGGTRRVRAITSAGVGGPLVAYRWDGESVLQASNFVSDVGQVAHAEPECDNDTALLRIRLEPRRAGLASLVRGQRLSREGMLRPLFKAWLPSTRSLAFTRWSKGAGAVSLTCLPAPGHVVEGYVLRSGRRRLGCAGAEGGARPRYYCSAPTTEVFDAGRDGPRRPHLRGGASGRKSASSNQRELREHRSHGHRTFGCLHSNCARTPQRRMRRHPSRARRASSFTEADAGRYPGRRALRMSRDPWPSQHESAATCITSAPFPDGAQPRTNARGWRASSTDPSMHRSWKRSRPHRGISRIRHARRALLAGA
jgi:hypothetical protein